MSATYKMLVTRAEANTAGLSPGHAQEKIRANGTLLIDVRERENYIEGYIPGAENVPRGFLELRIESMDNDRDRAIIVYGTQGQGALAAQALQDMGYSDVAYIQGDIDAWQNAGLDIDRDRVLNKAEVQRYSRHLLIPRSGRTRTRQTPRRQSTPHRRRRIGQPNRTLSGCNWHWAIGDCRCRYRRCHQLTTPDTTRHI